MKVVQIAVTEAKGFPGRIYLLTDTGRIFFGSYHSDRWNEVPLPPGCLTSQLSHQTLTPL